MKKFKLLYWRVCRAYARHILQDRPADKIMCWMSSFAFFRMHLYWPHFKSPQSFSEKIWHRMLFERSDLLTTLADKYLVREYVANKIGPSYLIPLLWKGKYPAQIPFDELPLKFVLKTNHGCGYNLIVKNKSELDQAKALIQLEHWLSENFCQDKYLGISWAYKNIKPIVMVESFLEKNGKVPEDYKFFCYSGKVEFIQVSFNRFGDASERMMDKDFQPIDLWNGLKLYQGEIERPANFEEMMKVAEALAAGFDFIRVDLYSVDDRVYFGELTSYPAGGMARFVPRKYDFLFGDKWKQK